MTVMQTNAKGSKTADAMPAAALVLTRTGLALAWMLMIVALANAWPLWPVVAFPMAGAFAAAGVLALIGRRVRPEPPAAAGDDTRWAELLIGSGL